MSIFLYKFKDWFLSNEYALPRGEGLFCVRHIIMLLLMFVWIVASYVIFSKHKNFAVKFTKFTCYFMVFSRVFRMVLETVTKVSLFIEVLPWHLCHIMAFVFPIMYLTNTKKFMFPILVVTFFGGLLTFMFGNYYKFEMFTFFDIESILLHFMMSAVVVSVIATNYYTLNLKHVYQVPIVLTLIILNACLGNYLCPNKNFLFLKENALPFNLFPNYSHLYTYAVVVLIIFIITFFPLLFISRYKTKKQQIYYVIE